MPDDAIVFLGRQRQQTQPQQKKPSQQAIRICSVMGQTHKTIFLEAQID
jgi:hypothetical protein